MQVLQIVRREGICSERQEEEEKSTSFVRIWKESMPEKAFKLNEDINFQAAQGQYAPRGMPSALAVVAGA